MNHSFRIELIGGPNDGEVYQVPSEVWERGYLLSYELAEPPRGFEPGLSPADASIEKVEVRYEIQKRLPATKNSAFRAVRVKPQQEGECGVEGCHNPVREEEQDEGEE